MQQEGYVCSLEVLIEELNCFATVFHIVNLMQQFGFDSVKLSIIVTNIFFPYFFYI